jgi:hypothetical protein
VPDTLYITVVSLKHEESHGLIKVAIDYDEKVFRRIFESFIYNQEEKANKLMADTHQVKERK